MDPARKAMLRELKQVLAEQDARTAPMPDAQAFVKDVLGYLLEWFHQEWLELQLTSRQNLVLAPRGHGKSTICTVSYPLWRLLRNPDLRVLIVSNTRAQACAFFREIRSHLESNPWVRNRFGDLAGKPWSDDQLNLSLRHSVSKEANLTAMGVLGPVISRHYDLIILDDIVDEQNAASQGQRERLATWFYRALLPCLEPDGEIHIIGTRYHHLDLYGQLIRREFKDRHKIYRALRETAEGEAALWPSKFPLELLREKRKDAGLAIFNSQYQNDVELMKGAIFRPEWINYFDSPPGGLEKIIGIDLAISAKDSADYFALVVAGRDKKSGKIMCLMLSAARSRSPTRLRPALNYYRKHDAVNSPVIRVAVESNGYQEAFAQKLREAGLPVKSVARVRDKISRAFQLQARLENGEVWFPRDGAGQLVYELILFPEAEHDDLFNALELAVAQVRNLDYKSYLRSAPEIGPE